jgi:hypothetical protein
MFCFSDPLGYVPAGYSTIATRSATVSTETTSPCADLDIVVRNPMAFGPFPIHPRSFHHTAARYACRDAHFKCSICVRQAMKIRMQHMRNYKVATSADMSVGVLCG